MQSEYSRVCRFGRLIEQQLSATVTGPAQSRRYEWDAASRLKAANAYLQQQGQEHLQTRIEFKRDKLGRLIEEMQRIYKAQTSAGANPAVEYEHHIAHQLDPLGNRQQTELQNAGSIGWLLYGSGHVHGLTHNGQSLIDFERNSLHRETKRQLHGANGSASIQITRWRDSLGRMKGIHLEQLPQAQIPAPQILIGQITSRQYHYDALGQITAIEVPGQTLRYGYDRAGRLRAMADSLKPEPTIGWDIDPAGNRLPGKTASGQQQQPDWAEQVHRSWRQHEFNLLGQGQNMPQQQGQVTKWQDNRIGYHGGSVWRYDKCGNRIEQVTQDGNGRYRRQSLSYDGAHQLTAVQVEGIDGQGDVTVLSASRYIYDALGRRLKKSVKDQNGQEHISYFGWDGDRLVHTERMKENGTRDIEQIVHEPNSFTPMLRLGTTVKGDPQAKPYLTVQAAQAVMPGQQKDNPSTTNALQGLQGAMAGMPEAARKMMEQSMKQALGGGLTEMSKSIMRGIGIDPDALIANMNRGIQEEKQKEQTPVAIHFYHCDHLGTPIALTDRQGNIVWAAKHDPWGNIQEEFNPHGIEQDIRLPGQHLDRETGLYYNRHRYYDPSIGSYINQDPIGLDGGINLYGYVLGDPVNGIDPSGLLLGGLINAGECYGDSAAQYWADKQVKTGNWLYAIPGMFAALWTPGTSDSTALTLISAGTMPGAANLAEWAGNPAMYELGAKTVPTAVWNKLGLAGMSVVERGSAIWGEYGLSSLGISGGPWLSTLMQGPTPGGWLAVVGLGSWANNKYGGGSSSCGCQ